VDGVEFDFTGPFSHRHTGAYSEILKGNGWEVQEAFRATRLIKAMHKMIPLSALTVEIAYDHSVVWEKNK